MARVLTICPETGQTVATHAELSGAQLARLRSPLHFYCIACHHPHAATPAEVWLEPAGPMARRAAE